MPIDPVATNTTTSVHGVLLSVYGWGVLLSGASGSGKSTLAWQLLQRGHALVSDDAPLLVRTGAALEGCADPILQGLLHVRGAGVLDVAQLLGGRSVQTRQRLDIVLRLTPGPCVSDPLEAPRRFCSLLGISLPELCIAADAPQRADLAEALLRAELVQRSSEGGQCLLRQRLQNALQAAPLQVAPSQAAPELRSCV